MLRRDKTSRMGTVQDVNRKHGHKTRLVTLRPSLCVGVWAHAQVTVSATEGGSSQQAMPVREGLNKLSTGSS